MKVIFVKNLPKVAKINEIKDQPDGYVRNFLIPQGYAVIATPQAIQKLERSLSEVKVMKEIEKDLFKKNLKAVDGVGVTITANANDNGHLFSSVQAKDIIEALKKQHHIMMAPEYIVLPEPIKQLGTFSVSIEALGMKEAITVNVVAGK
jgi:large subunit ribosomal protein L9